MANLSRFNLLSFEYKFEFTKSTTLFASWEISILYQTFYVIVLYQFLFLNCVHRV